MKKIILSIAQTLFIIVTYSQTSTSYSNCGWQYFYDNAGNRIARAYVNCPISSAKKSNDSISVKQDNVIENIDLFIAYPNPTIGDVNISLNTELVNNLVTIIDQQGKIVYENYCSGKELLIDISNFQDGIYHISVFTNNTTKTKAIVKKSSF